MKDGGGGGGGGFQNDHTNINKKTQKPPPPPRTPNGPHSQKELLAKTPALLGIRHVYEYPSITKAYRCILRQYSEPFHGQDSFNQAQFSHIQEYSEPCLTLVYAETWHIWNPEMFKNLP